MTATAAGRAAPRTLAILAAAALAAASTGCGSVYVGTEGSDPATRPMLCDQPSDEPSGTHILLAQSVPTASAVPCLRSETGDWVMTNVEVRDGLGRIELSHRYGDEDTATLELTAECDVSDAHEVASQFEGVRRDTRELTRAGRYASESFYVYPGACTWLRFHLTGDGARLRSAEITGALSFVSRDHIDRQIREASDGHLHLDPG
jgi:hypothetical protein